MSEIDLKSRIAELEDVLTQRDAKIVDLRNDLGERDELISEMREQLRANYDTVDGWVQVFDMHQDDDGRFVFDPRQTAIWDEFEILLDKHKKLVTKWNANVADFNRVVAPKDIGRPLAASETQQADVLKRHKAGESLRAIAKATSLGVRTVRTIIEKPAGADRASRQAKERKRIAFDRMRAAAFRARKRSREGIPKQIGQLQARNEALIKASKAGKL